MLELINYAPQFLYPLFVIHLPIFLYMYFNMYDMCHL